ncbi:hypothetical protein N8529_00385 [bacterium]|nr:hypothetical protein [bacterium]
MLKNVSKKAPKVSDPELVRVLNKVYDDINELSNSVNREFEDDSVANRGDIKVVDGKLEYHTGSDWKVVDIDKINRILFSATDAIGSLDSTSLDGSDLTPLQTQINNNLKKSKFFFFWGAN